VFWRRNFESLGFHADARGGSRGGGSTNSSAAVEAVAQGVAGLAVAEELAAAGDAMVRVGVMCVSEDALKGSSGAQTAVAGRYAARLGNGVLAGLQIVGHVPDLAPLLARTLDLGRRHELGKPKLRLAPCRDLKLAAVSLSRPPGVGGAGVNGGAAAALDVAECLELLEALFGVRFLLHSVRGRLEAAALTLWPSSAASA
jgi:hypothetical protein